MVYIIKLYIKNCLLMIFQERKKTESIRKFIFISSEPYTSNRLYYIINANLTNQAHLWYCFFMEVFAERLKELRLEKGLSQNQLAKATGLTHAAISRWESGLRQPTAAAIITLAGFFGVTSDYLLGLED